MSYQAPQSSALSSDQEGLLTQIVNLLQMLVSNGGLPDPLTRRTRVLLEAVTAANISTNMAQVNGVATTTGVGLSSTGTIRVAPSTDTQGGLPVMHTQACLPIIYNASVVS